MHTQTVSNTMPLRYCRGHETNITLSGSGFETLYHPNCRFSKPTGTPYYGQYKFIILIEGLRIRVVWYVKKKIEVEIKGNLMHAYK